MKSQLERLVRELSVAFDESFARPHAEPAPEQIDVLEIRVAGAPYGLRLPEVLAVHADRRLVSAPSRRSDLLGLVGLRGEVAPVYDLGKLLGHGNVRDLPRWISLVKASAPFAVAFEQFVRHRRVAKSAITRASSQMIAGSVEGESGPLPLIDLSALFRAVTSGTGRGSVPEREETP